MLNLSLGIFSNYQEDRKVPLTSSAGEEESNLSSSSTSSTDFATDKRFITFGILKRDDDVVPPPPTHKETGDLFPVKDACRNIEFFGDDSHWLNLSSSQRSKQQMVKKSRRGPRSRSSQYRGVTFYRRTGRWESHIWDCGKQVYLGGFDTAYAAARAYDRAAIKFRGLDADINFIVDDYTQDMNKMKNLNKVEFVQTLRRESASFGRGSSKYKGLTIQKCTQFKTHNDQVHLFQNRKWDAAIKGAELMKFGSHIKGTTTKVSTDPRCVCLVSIHPSIYQWRPLKTVAASSGFPFITMTTSSSSMPTCFDP